MGMASVVSEQHKFPENVCTEDTKVIADNETPAESKKINGHLFNFYRHMLEVSKSVLLIVFLLALYKITGFHALWMQLVEKIM